MVGVMVHIGKPAMHQFHSHAGRGPISVRVSVCFVVGTATITATTIVFITDSITVCITTAVGCGVVVVHSWSKVVWKTQTLLQRQRHKRSTQRFTTAATTTTRSRYQWHEKLSCWLNHMYFLELLKVFHNRVHVAVNPFPQPSEIVKHATPARHCTVQRPSYNSVVVVAVVGGVVVVGVVAGVAGVAGVGRVFTNGCHFQGYPIFTGWPGFTVQMYIQARCSVIGCSSCCWCRCR